METTPKRLLFYETNTRVSSIYGYGCSSDIVQTGPQKRFDFRGPALAEPLRGARVSRQDPDPQPGPGLLPTPAPARRAEAFASRPGEVRFWPPRAKDRQLGQVTLQSTGSPCPGREAKRGRRGAAGGGRRGGPNARSPAPPAYRGGARAAARGAFRPGQGRAGRGGGAPGAPGVGRSDKGFQERVWQPAAQPRGGIWGSGSREGERLLAPPVCRDRGRRGRMNFPTGAGSLPPPGRRGGGRRRWQPLS